MSSLEEPLISRSSPSEGEETATADYDGAAPEDDAAAIPPPSSPPPSTFFIYLLTLSAGLSGLLFGYDTGVISATLVTLGTSLSGRELTALDKSAIASATSLAALLASPLASVLADSPAGRIGGCGWGGGRRRVLLAADGLFALGAAVQAASGTVAAMVLGRAVVGAGLGAASFAAPLYIAELAPPGARGRLVTLNVVCITLGQVAAYLVGWALGEFGPEGSAWRWMVGLGGVPAVVQGVLLLFMPETPRWLVMVGRVGEARRVVAKVLGGQGGKKEVDSTVKGIEIEVREEAEARRWRTRGGGNGTGGWMDSLGELLRVRRNRRALAIACLLQGFQQLCGFNSLMYFSATIFTMLGFPIPTLTSLVVAVTNFAFTLAALFLIDRIGRRRILLWSIPFMVVGLLLAAYGFSFIELAAPDSTKINTSPAQNAAIIILVSIMVYVGGYAIGLGNVPWMQSELFALNIRSLGSGIATATNWGANFVIGLTFLLLMDALTPSWTFVLYAGICAIGYSLIWKFYPETAGLSLEEAATLLEDDNWGGR